MGGSSRVGKAAVRLPAYDGPSLEGDDRALRLYGRPNDPKGNTMIEESREIEQVLRDTLDALSSSDVDAIARRTSREACVVGIGSDPAEWAEGYDELIRLWRDSAPDGELGVKIGLDDVKGFREGSVGWAASRGYFEINGERVRVRMTVVLHQEDGEWKTVQTHASIGVPNDRMLDPMLEGGV